MQGDLVLRNVSKSYGAIRALDEVNLTIRRGEFLTVLGPSGSGKSTLLMVLAGFIDPETGSMRLGERELLDLRPHQRNIGVVFQNYALFPHMNVHQNVAFPLRMRGMDRQEIEHRVSRALQLVHLESLKGREIDQLSGGQRQRVALARAIVFEPPLLLMDEPLSALDKKLREQMQLEIRRLHGQLGTTTIYVTHDQREAITLSDRVAVLDRGRLVQVDSPRDLYERPHDRFIADFVGECAFRPWRTLDPVMADTGGA